MIAFPCHSERATDFHGNRYESRPRRLVRVCEYILPLHVVSPPFSTPGHRRTSPLPHADPDFSRFTAPSRTD